MTDLPTHSVEQEVKIDQYWEIHRTITKKDLLENLQAQENTTTDTLLSKKSLTEMLDTILNSSNIENYSVEQLIKHYYAGKIEIQCVDGRSVKRNDKLVIHTPGGEIALYGQLLKALAQITQNEYNAERIFGRFLDEKLGNNSRREWIYAHSDTHGKKAGDYSDDHPNNWHHEELKTYSYGKFTNINEFQCGCGHCNGFMTKEGYNYTAEQKAVINNIYPAQPDKLAGEHLEQAIMIQGENEDGSLSSIKSNALNNGTEQVFSYDVVAIKKLIAKLSEETEKIAKGIDITLTAADLEKVWNEIHDNDTYQTVHVHLKKAVDLVKDGKVYTMQKVWKKMTYK